MALAQVKIPNRWRCHKPNIKMYFMKAMLILFYIHFPPCFIFIYGFSYVYLTKRTILRQRKFHQHFFLYFIFSNWFIFLYFVIILPTCSQKVTIPKISHAILKERSFEAPHGGHLLNYSRHDGED